jgi:hypothetical protein
MLLSQVYERSITDSSNSLLNILPLKSQNNIRTGLQIDLVSPKEQKKPAYMLYFQNAIAQAVEKHRRTS